MPTLQTDYHVANGQVTLTIIIGDAQLGSSLVSLNGKELQRGDDIVDCPIGNGPDIKGKALKIDTVINDVNDATNHTSVTYQLKGGIQDSTYNLEGTVASEGDSLIYRATFNLI